MWVIGGIASLAAPLAVIGLAAVPRVKQLARLGAWFNLAFGALMTAYVFGADTYTNDGRSRWATRGGGEHAVYLVAMGIVLVCSVALAVLAARGTRGRLVRPVLLLSGVADAVIEYSLFLAFANN